jgi:hypothetical protein
MSDLLPLRRHDETSALTEESDLPPVVARMVIEIRSDGTRTLARGAIEDRLRGETVQLKLESGSPLALAKQLAETLLGTPGSARKALTAALTSRFRRR